MTIGIYGIRNKVDAKMYVGSSRNIEKRLQTHYNNLKKGTHWNKHLQNSWNKYGEDNFETVIIEELDNPDLLIERENHHMDINKSLDRNYGYNLIKASETPDTTGMKMSDESKRKMSEMKKGERNSFYGKKHTPEAIRKIKKARKKQVFSPDSRKKLSEHMKKNMTKEHFDKLQKGAVEANKRRKGKPRANAKGYHALYNKNKKVRPYQLKVKVGDKYKSFGTFDTREEAEERGREIKELLDRGVEV